MPAAHDCPNRRIEESVLRPTDDGDVTWRARARDGRLCLFNMKNPAPQLPDDCEAVARAVADHLVKYGLHRPAPGTRFAIEDQDGNLLAHAVMQPWEEQCTFTLYSQTGDQLITWPIAGRQEADK
jgi:hypothetical protein